MNAIHPHRMPRYGFLLPLLLPPLVPLGWWLGGGWIFLLPAVVWVALPLADWWLGPDATNPDPAQIRTLGNDPFYRYVTWLHVPITCGLVVWAASAASSANTLLEWYGLALATGIITGGIGITVAHELGHRPNRFERFLAHFLLAWVAYGHFLVEHNKGHHAKVATEEDPATARYNEGFWSFFPRTVYGQLRSAWRIDPKTAGLSLAGPLLIVAGFAGLFGPLAVLFFLVQALTAILHLELVNYVEHYGLRRRELAPGRYEPVSPRHSWNSSHRLSNLLLFNLQRHSHHHVNVGRRYQGLEHYDDAPQLPAGYLAMLPLALCPPLWRRLMNPRVPPEQARLSA